MFPFYNNEATAADTVGCTGLPAASGLEEVMRTTAFTPPTRSVHNSCLSEQRLVPYQ